MKLKCSECEFAKYLNVLNAYTCDNPKCKDVPVFRGKTKPHCCPLSGGKKYTFHKNRKPIFDIRLPYRG